MVDIECNAGNFVSKYLNVFHKIHFYEINPFFQLFKK